MKGRIFDMKKVYENPRMTVSAADAQDVIATSLSFQKNSNAEIRNNYQFDDYFR